jgi:hypothetical protein
MESAGALDKTCLRKINRVKRALGQGKISFRSLLAALYNGLAIIE